MSKAWLGEPIERAEPLYWEWLFGVQGQSDGYMPPSLAIRSKQWKLFVNHDGSKPELYDIVKDPAERNNIALDHPETVGDLAQKAISWSRSLPPSQLRTSKTTPTQSPRTTKKSPSQPNRAAIFSRWDKDENQQLEPEEYRLGVKASDHQERFQKFDKDQNGTLSFDEFVYPAGKPPE
jgi:hypothetical protein